MDHLPHPHTPSHFHSRYTCFKQFTFYRALPPEQIKRLSKRKNSLQKDKTIPTMFEQNVLVYVALSQELWLVFAGLLGKYNKISVCTLMRLSSR